MRFKKVKRNLFCIVSTTLIEGINKSENAIVVAVRHFDLATALNKNLWELRGRSLALT